MNLRELIYRTVDKEDLWVMGSPIMDKAGSWLFKLTWRKSELFELRISGRSLGFYIWFLKRFDDEVLNNLPPPDPEGIP